MKVIAALVLLLLNVHLSQCCYGEGQILFCLDIPQAFRPGFSSLVMVLKDIGEINSTVFHSDDLVSITRLRIEGAGVTGIAEGAFRSLQNLRDLSLIQNLLTEVNPGWLSQAAVLSELRLTENHIEALTESMFNSLTGLTHLKLNRNRIREIQLNTFSSQNRLSELDLSDNKMTRVSPQVFRFFRSTRIRLDGNPWDCSCGAEDFVNFLKDLLSRSLLDRPLDVTCESPSSVRGWPVWNVSVCETSPSPSPTSVMQSVKPKPTDFRQTSTRTSEKVTNLSTTSETVPMTTQSHSGTSPTGATLGTKPSNPPGPTDIPKTVTTSTLNPAPGTSPQSVTDVSDHPKPFDPSRPVPTPTENHEASPSSTTEISDHPKETCTSRPLQAANIVCTLPIVIVVLSFLLCTVCFLVVLHRRKRRDRCVMPEKENTPEESEISSVSSQSVYLSEEKENTEICATEAGWRSFSGVRAKSANALLFTSPFCVSVKHQPTIQTETQPKQTEQSGNKGDIKRGIEVGNSTEIAEVKSKQATESRNLDEKPCSVHTDPVPYFSIGTNQNENITTHFNHESSVNERSDFGKVMERTSTWPPTAIQWQERYKMMKEEEKERSDGFTVWTTKLPVEKVVKEKGHSSHSEQETTEDATDKNHMDESLKIDQATMNLGNSLSSKLDEKTSTRSEDQQRKAELIHDLNPTMTPSKKKLSHNQDLTLADEITNMSRSNNKTERRNDHKRAVTSRSRAGNRSTGSQAPSGGATPDDETLLSGNEYAFMDLLHEVVQNNGRWTRERWRQTHVNKQRR